MSTSKDYSEAELLAYFDRICSCDIDAEALAELQMVLRTQPDAQAMFLQYMLMHAGAVSGAVRLSRVRKIFESEVQLRVDATPTLRTHAKRWGTRLVPILAIAAAVLLLLWPTGPPQAEPILNWPDAVATLNRVEGVVWSETGSQYDVTSILTSGNSLQFLSGLVELELRQGAVVVLEGPAHLVVDDVNRATLLDGKLAAVVRLGQRLSCGYAGHRRGRPRDPILNERIFRSGGRTRSQSAGGRRRSRIAGSRPTTPESPTVRRRGRPCQPWCLDTA